MSYAVARNRVSFANLKIRTTAYAGFGAVLALLLGLAALGFFGLSGSRASIHVLCEGVDGRDRRQRLRRRFCTRPPLCPANAIRLEFPAGDPDLYAPCPP